MEQSVAVALDHVGDVGVAVEFREFIVCPVVADYGPGAVAVLPLLPVVFLGYGRFVLDHHAVVAVHLHAIRDHRVGERETMVVEHVRLPVPVRRADNGQPAQPVEHLPFTVQQPGGGGPEGFLLPFPVLLGEGRADVG